jgi:uncharacterized Zn finger protein (UPF0148 family)
MSDFDEEAEREKLRKRFEAEEKDRETTERMSELLLQGATMTNSHCKNCHSPLFTYEDRTFCPTCQVEVDTEADAGDAETTSENGAHPDRADTDRTGSPTPIEVDDPAEQPTGETVSESPATGGDQYSDEATRPRDSPEPDLPSANIPDRPAIDDRSPSGRPSTAATNDMDHLAEAQASLSHTLARLSATADRSDDLSRTREHLRATKEAADALAALKQARR